MVRSDELTQENAPEISAEVPDWTHDRKPFFWRDSSRSLLASIRAPAWMQNIGLEWLWRIKEEPMLWRRYFGDGLALLTLLV